MQRVTKESNLEGLKWHTNKVHYLAPIRVPITNKMGLDRMARVHFTLLLSADTGCGPHRNYLEFDAVLYINDWVFSSGGESQAFGNSKHDSLIYGRGLHNSKLISNSFYRELK